MTNIHSTKKEEKVHSVFKTIASKYDVMNSVLSFNRHKAWRKFTMKKMQVENGQVALDVCTGTADWAISLAEAVGEGGNVVGLDFCQEMLDEGQKKIDNKNISDKIKLVNGNAMQIDYPNDTFDFATIGFALRNVPDIQKAIDEMTRVVKPGGKVVSLELSKPQFPPFKAIYYMYFNHILPLLGKLAVGKSEPYSWLPESLVDFPDHKQLKVMFEKSGLETEVYLLTGGIAALHIGIKRGRNGE